MLTNCYRQCQQYSKEQTMLKNNLLSKQDNCLQFFYKGYVLDFPSEYGRIVLRERKAQMDFFQAMQFRCLCV